jgi:histone acetyltransferase (RNA polymerase elongator complex component)
MKMKPIFVDIVTRVMTTFGHCRSCNLVFHQTGFDKTLQQRETNEYPADLREEFSDLTTWIRELNRLYRHRLRIRLIDAQSLGGLYRSLRYRIRKYPTFIVEGKETYSGWDREKLESLLDKYLRGSLVPKKV